LSAGGRILSRNPLDITAALGVETKTNLMPLNLEVFHGKESPKLARRQKVAASAFVPQGLTYLEVRSVRSKTVKDYQQRMDKFTTWLRGTTSKILTPEDLDFCLVEYMNEMFLKGEGIDAGIRIHAAVRFFFPFLGRPAAGTLPRVVRALKGWSMASPPKQRLPLPVEALGAIMGKILERGHPQLVLRLFIQFLTYLRPGELSGLTVGQMIAPQSAMSQRFSTWAILLHPVEGEVPGKTGIYDATVLLDSDPWMDPLLKALTANRKPDEMLWLDPHQKLVKEFSKAVTDLGLEHLGTCLYTLRHGGATHDILTRRRSMLEVKQRGRWQSDNSLRRYVKLARLQHEQSKIPKSVSETGLQVIANLPQLLHAALPGIQLLPRECQRKLRLSRAVQR
jgi:integrase